MKKYICLIGLSILFLFGIEKFFGVPQGANEPLAYRFTFVCPLTWDGVKGGIEAADQELGTNTKSIGFKNLNEDKQVQAIQKAIYSNVDGIITAGTNASEKLREVIEEAQDQGIPVILVNADLPDSQRTCYIGMDHMAAGELAGKEMAKAAGKNANIGIIVSSLEDENQKQRLEGFRRAVGEDAVIAQILECNSDRMRIRRLVQQMLMEKKDMNAIFCSDEIAADMLGEVLEQEGYSAGDMHVICMGMSQQINTYIQEGWYDSSVFEDTYAQGYKAVSCLRDWLNGIPGIEQVQYTEVKSAGKDFDFEAWLASWGAPQGEWRLL